MDPELAERGVQNPQVVDLISRNPETGEVVLVMLEERDWGADPAQIPQIEAKFNSYLSYVQGGYMAREYPQYAECKVSFQLDCASPPRAQDQAFLTAIRNFAAAENIRFAIQVTSPSQ